VEEARSFSHRKDHEVCAGRRGQVKSSQLHCRFTAVPKGREYNAGGLPLFTALRKIGIVLNRGGSSRRAARLQPSLKNVRQKIPPNGQTRLKFGFSYENLTTQSFSVLPAPFLLNVSRNPTKPMFRCFPTTPLMRWRFQHTCRWIWRFWGCLRHSPKGKKPNIWLQNHGGISAYRKAFSIFWRWIFKEKTEEICSWLFFTTWISWILNFIIKFNSAFASTLAILAALDSNLVANLGLWKYSPSFICTSAACNNRLSWWAF